MKKKKSTTPEELCSGFPPELAEYVRYTRNLEFEQNPDYNYLRGLFRKILEDKGYDINDVRFDWSKDIKNKESTILNKVNLGKNNFEVNYDEKEKDMQNNNNDIVNKHLITNNNFEDVNVNKKKNNGERVNTQFANYNTTVQVTDNANNAFQIGDDKNVNDDKKNLNKSANNFDSTKGNNDRFGQTGNDNLKKKKKGKDKCNIF